MPSLQSRAPMQRFHLLRAMTRFVSFLVVALLLCACWVGVCYLKSSLDNHNPTGKMNTGFNAFSLTPDPVSLKLNQGAATLTDKQRREGKLVYSCSTDKEFYHTAKHLSPHCARIALSEAAALERGLKHCSICFTE